MTKRADGWYRVWIHENKSKSKFILTNPCLMKWDSETESFNSEYWSYKDQDLHKIDPKMVMSIEGELVYHQHNKHDPLYNTKQEG